MHKLLVRQLRRCLDLDPSGPVPETLKPLLDAVNAAYEQADSDRLLLERSLELSSHELLESNAKLRESQSKAMRVEKLAAVGQLASSVSHELRNPLGAVSNALYYVRDSLREIPSAAADLNLGEYFEIADREMKRALSILADLSEFSKIRELSRQPVRLQELLAVVLKSLEIPRGVTVIQDFQDGLPAVVVDGYRIQQVFVNISTNALQAMPEGGTFSVTVRFDPSADAVSISFKDTGTGISPDVIKKIFDPLFTTKAQGTGLGLAICQEIVEAHGGRIDVESLPNEGSVFKISLPVSPRI